MRVRPWWETYEGLLEWELAQLKRAGIRHKLDERFMRNHGAVRIDVWPEVGGEERYMWAVFPDLYPWFRPEVVSPSDDLDKHQGPFQKNLCLLDRPASAWDPGRASLARMLMEQLPKVYAAQDPENSEDLEVHQAEPFSTWYPYEVLGGFVIDGEWSPNAASGTFEYVPVRLNPEDGTLVAFVLRILDSSGRTLGEADPVLRERCGRGHILTGGWARLDAPPHTNDASELRRVLGRANRRLRGDRSEAVPTSRGSLQLDVVAAVFQEQADYRGGTADAWLFALTVHLPGTSREQRRHGGGGKPRLARGMRGGRSDLALRIPELAPLADKTAAVFGIGGVGAPSAAEFARAGVKKLWLVDRDHAEPAAGVRHPLGHAEAGRLKVAALAENLGSQHPLMRVAPLALPVGGVRLDGGEHTDVELLTKVMEETDLVYDATGDHGVGLFLCDLAFSHGVPYVTASTTQGAWGGRVALFRPGEGPCYECLLSHIRDEGARGEISAEESLVPPEDPEGEIRPAGCADATFTGAGFDVAPAALAGVRLAVSALCGGADGAYPPVSWNIAVLRLRDEGGSPLAGTASHITLARHPECGECRRRSG